jgi:hypothetical protein
MCNIFIHKSKLPSKVFENEVVRLHPAAMDSDERKRGGRRAGAGRKAKARPLACAEPIGPLLAERCAQARREREEATGASISLRDLASASGLSVPTLRGILAGTGDPRASGLCGLAKALRVRPGWLLGD